MKKISKKFLVVLFVTCTFGLASSSDNDIYKSSSDLLKSQVDEKMSQLNDQEIHDGVINYLEHNIKKHRDSSRYKLILVNDKISNKYTTLNYMINKQLRNGVNAENARIEKQ